ncbi:hypothetical protein PVK06_038904 [Gossypium arboreum]|uniref:Uncharacterized protein n=1 Tax=Gossypium arboreum TaxID=29729 RepID=A0ABR0N1F3_GOSAR|nr:hypothetical protein PVK06_038904 [Gossypium arboreum]
MLTRSIVININDEHQQRREPKTQNNNNNTSCRDYSPEPYSGTKAQHDTSSNIYTPQEATRTISESAFCCSSKARSSITSTSPISSREFPSGQVQEHAMSTKDLKHSAAILPFKYGSMIL